MARTANGFAIRWHRGAWQMRCTVEGTRYERSTGVRDRGNRALATSEARRIFGEILRGEAPGSAHRKADEERRVSRCVAVWLTQLSDVREPTRNTYRYFARYWSRAFETIDLLTEREIASYLRARLGDVRGKTVRSEVSALRKFLDWLIEDGKIREAPTVPTVRSSVSGTPWKRKRCRVRAPELSPDEVEAFLAALPVKSATGLWVRDRFVVAYETTLRPTTIARLSVPQNYSHGSKTIRLTDEDDKELYGRELPLRARARKALDRCCPESGLIFGRHDLFDHIRRAALATLPAHKAQILCGQHLRSAGITRLLELTGNLPGVQFLAGHKQASTTGRYSRPSRRAADAVVATADRIVGHDSGSRTRKLRKSA